jgi:hypothetical protein
VFMWHTVQVQQQHGITLCCVRLWCEHAPLAAVACTHCSITTCAHQPCMLYLCALVSTASYLCLSTKAFPVSQCAHRIMCLLALALAAWASFAVWGWCGCGSAPQAMHACMYTEVCQQGHLYFVGYEALPGSIGLCLCRMACGPQLTSSNLLVVLTACCVSNSCCCWQLGYDSGACAQAPPINRLCDPRGVTNLRMSVGCGNCCAVCTICLHQCDGLDGRVLPVALLRPLTLSLAADL